MYHTRFDNAIANDIQNLDEDCKDKLWYLDRTTALRRSFELRQHSAASDKTVEAAQLSFFSSRSQSPVYGWSRLKIETGFLQGPRCTPCIFEGAHAVCFGMLG